jgi:hypothetical protein
VFKLTVAKGLEARPQAARAPASGGQRFVQENLPLTIGENTGASGLGGLVPLAMRFRKAGRICPWLRRRKNVSPANGNGKAGEVR